MIRKTTITASGAALLGATFLVVACSDSPEDNGGDNGGGGTGPNGGVSGTGQGGTGPATGGTGVTGGTPGTGGTGVTGGTPGTGGAGGAGTGGGGGAAAMGPFSCAMPNTVNCGSIGDFPTGSAQTFGDGTFSGGISVFGAGISRDMNDTTKLHITGMVTGYGHGFNIWMTACSTFAAYDGIAFTISGTTGDTPMNTIDFQLQSNTDYPWQPRVADAKGACTAPGTQDPYGYCIAPTLNVMLSPTATPASQTVTWAMMMGGMPTPWSATTMPAELVGIQWQFPWTPTKTAYAVDVTLDDVKFSGGSGPTAACPAYMPGGGGMGGAGGAGGGAGGAGGAGGGAAGGGAGGAAGGAGKAGGGGMAGGAGQAGGGAGGAASGAGGMAGRAGGGMGGT